MLSSLSEARQNANFDENGIEETKWFFVDMFLQGGLIVPALDALSLKLRSTVPSFKKKKGALPATVDQVQKQVWTVLKQQLKQY